MAAIQESSTTSPIGKRTPRVDGPLKVTGKAKYTSDFHFPGLLYAVPVEATIANGRIIKLDTAQAEKMPGVRAIFHRKNIGKIARAVLGEGFEGITDERRPPFEDDVIRYYGQYVALAVASTFETAKAAADAVRVEYSKEKPNVDTHLKADDEPDTVATTFATLKRVQSERGDAAGAFENAAVKLDETYVTPAETQNPLELHSTTAIWDGTTLTLYESSQGVVNLQTVLAQMFGLPNENVRVITKFVGSGFGSKLFPWTHCPLAAAAARQLGKPVKLVVSRKMMFQTVGHRPRTQQRVRLGATPEGKLVSLQHDYVYTTSMLDIHHEDCGETTAFHYSVPNLRVAFGLRKAKHRRHCRHARTRRRPRHVCDRVGNERVGRSAQDRSGKASRSQRAEIRRIAGRAFFVAAPAGVPGSWFGKVRLVEANAGNRLDETRWPDAGLGHGRLCMDCRTLSGRGQCTAARRRHGPRSLCHAGYRHRNVYHSCPTRGRKDRRAARQSRGCAGRYVVARRSAFGRFDGDWIRGAGRLFRGGSCNRCAARHRNQNARVAVRKTQIR